MTETKNLLRKASKLFDVADVPHSTRRHNRHGWVRAVSALGPKWRLHPDRRATRLPADEAA